ncbi:MAG: carbohydrate ABC transporter permease [Acholeplasmataceae bacterium]|jgi:ABC-type glycerol-3-phosphate transport system permease component|nr:carbohydrate ABC transporter permease [Acholeplasmataceae bacterium]MCK9289719.1 carbohydrate ABC transporter permease [Acholeplasmataceae bacterium]MCK9428188.1 carbohydrate ABC transporter permease [Acholeplasmataceae bacterium]MDD4090874.1 carbohydrate ABC transporter permease [Acholeplasmataceae bacterium]HHT40018.1 carbohydrate ABC transporter permease [Acholeplasmataceae bacterium]
MASLGGTKINPSKFHYSQLKFYFILVPVALIMALPIVYIFSHAFKPIEELFLWPPKFLVRRPTLKNFKDLMQTTSTAVPMARYLFNSVAITLGLVFVSIVISTMAGYALSKLEFKLKKPLLILNNIALMFVGASVVIPRYLVVEKLGLLDNFLVYILPTVAMPVGLFLVKQFIDQIPQDLLEAARIDGASDLRIYWSIILPLIKPAIATIAIVSFQMAWNDAGIANLYIDNEALKNFAFYMSTLTTQTNIVTGQGMAAAAALIMFIPNLVIFIILQRNVMNTMAHSGIK